MKLRPAVPADAAAIARIEAAASPVPWSEAQVAASLAEPTTGGWVLEDVGEVVGHLLASAQADEGEVLIVAVLPSWRRRGGGRRLVEAAVAWWRERGVTHGYLEVRADNAGARALYTDCGFTEVGRRPAYYRDGTDALVLRRPL